MKKRKFKHLSEQEFNDIKMLLEKFNQGQAIRLSGRSYNVVVKVDKCADFEEYVALRGQRRGTTSIVSDQARLENILKNVLGDYHRLRTDVSYLHDAVTALQTQKAASHKFWN